MNCEQLNFSNLNPLYIISYLNCYYQLQNEKVISIINIIFHLKDDINVEKILLQDIYILDDYCDTFLSNVISIEELKKHVHFFFLKYSVKIPDVLQFFF